MSRPRRRFQLVLRRARPMAAHEVLFQEEIVAFERLAHLDAIRSIDRLAERLRVGDVRGLEVLT